MRKVNLLSVELDEQIQAGPFRHAGATLGPMLGAERIHGGLYQGEAGRWIWPNHYHHGVEEWLYVLARTPVLRDPGGERTLRAGDLVAFPSGHVGAHTVAGPGRFVIFSTGDHIDGIAGALLISTQEMPSQVFYPAVERGCSG
ncbi:MAG: cupin domain-containing protein [Solirubrobacteraceae bacterium]